MKTAVRNGRILDNLCVCYSLSSSHWRIDCAPPAAPPASPAHSTSPLAHTGVYANFLFPLMFKSLNGIQCIQTPGIKYRHLEAKTHFSERLRFCIVKKNHFFVFRFWTERVLSDNKTNNNFGNNYSFKNINCTYALSSK